MKQKIITSVLSLALALQCAAIPVNAQPEDVPDDDIAVEDELVPDDDIVVEDELVPVDDIVIEDETDEEFVLDAVSEETAELMATSGTCGDNLTWTLDDDGTLTISGTGYMTSWRYGSSVWYNCENIKTVVIEDGVTSIGSYAFRNCSSLTSVTIPDSVTSISSCAFYGCSSLTSVTIPDSITSIGSYAFDGCSSLTSVTIPDSVESIGKYAFYGCGSLTSVYISDIAAWCNIAFEYSESGNYNPYTSNPLCYAENLYLNGELVTELVIPDSVTSISNYAFRNCSSLTSVTIGNGVTSIGEYAFDRCSSLTSVYYNASTVFNCGFGSSIGLVVLGDNVTSIDTSAFSDCRQLRRIVIPKSVSEINNNAFANCSKLVTVEYGGSEDDWEEIYIGSGNDYLSNANFVFNSSLKNTGLTDLDCLTYTVNDNNTVTITDCYSLVKTMNVPAEINGVPVTTVNANTFANRTKLTKVTLPDSVTSIGNQIFSNSTALKNAVLSNGITNISNSAFYGCTALECVYIPKNVTTINNYAFYDCNSLTDVYYNGSEAEWNAISVGYSNDCLANATIHFNSTMPEVIEFVPLVSATAQKVGSSISVAVENAYDGSVAYASFYDADGKFIAIASTKLDASGNADISTVAGAASARVFVWTNNMQPTTAVQPVEL